MWLCGLVFKGALPYAEKVLYLMRKRCLSLCGKGVFPYAEKVSFREQVRYRPCNKKFVIRNF
jgi:hypothetical protein